MDESDSSDKEHKNDLDAVEDGDGRQGDDGAAQVDKASQQTDTAMDKEFEESFEHVDAPGKEGAGQCQEKVTTGIDDSRTDALEKGNTLKPDNQNISGEANSDPQNIPADERKQPTKERKRESSIEEIQSENKHRIARYQKSKAESEVYISQLKKKVSELTDQNSKLQTDLDRSKTLRGHIEQQYKGELTRKKAEKDNMDKEIKTLNKENTKLSESLKKVDRKFEDQKKANTELCEKQVRLQKENASQKEELQEAREYIEKLESAYRQNMKELQDKDHRIKEYESHVNYKNNVIAGLTNDLHKSEEDRNKLTLRLSKLAGAHLTRDNPNIADLSDMNRPTKLAEKYSELYDNEWTDAFEELGESSGLDEVTSVSEMLKLLKATYDECVKLTEPHREILRRLTTVTLTVDTDTINDKERSLYAIGKKYKDAASKTHTACEDHSCQIDYSDKFVQFGAKVNEEKDGLRNEEVMETEDEDRSMSQESIVQQGDNASELENDDGSPHEPNKALLDQSKSEIANDDKHLLKCTSNQSKNDDEHSNDHPAVDEHLPGSHTTTDAPNNTAQLSSHIGSPNDAQAEHLPVSSVSNLPSGFSTNVDTGQITTEVTVNVEFTAEQKKLVSDMKKVCATKLEEEMHISQMIAQTIVLGRNINPETRPRLIAYIKKCAELCWYMTIQEPPVVIGFRDQTENQRFDKDTYKAYTQIGKRLDFVVWPPMYLHKDGPMLCKGTAQGTD